MIATNDERTSQSPSDDGSTYLFPDHQKIDPELDADEEGGSLTSQTLNADGTPKRPMNAFMIFARRRRPQVSSENQSMRTGEISKILSKEWNSMPSSEKQFYLDRAKQLKETFNSKYPDYVYRRRPNNSRKRRRTDASHSVDGSAPPDSGDDLARVGDLGESSPTEGDDSHFDAHSVQYLRLPHDTSQTYGEHGSLQSRTPSMLYTSSDPYRHTSSHDSRLPYLSTAQDRPNHTIPPPNTLPSPRTSHPGVPSLPPFLGSHQNPAPSSIYSSGWDSRLDSHARSTSSGWLGPSGGTSSDRSSSMSASRGQSYAGSSSSPTGSWPGSGSPNPSGGSGAAPSSMYDFPTLNSPYYPPQSQLHSTSTGGSGSASAFGSGGSSNSLPAPHLGSSGGSGNGGGRSSSYDHRSFAGSPSLGGSGSYTPTNGNGRDSFAQSSSRHGSSILPRAALPPVQSIPGYAQPHSLFSSNSSTSSNSDLHDIWSRNAVSGPP